MARWHPCAAMRCFPSRVRLLPSDFCWPAPDLQDPSCAALFCACLPTFAHSCPLVAVRCLVPPSCAGSTCRQWPRRPGLQPQARPPAGPPPPPGQRGGGADGRLASQRRHPQPPPPPIRCPHATTRSGDDGHAPRRRDQGRPPGLRRHRHRRRAGAGRGGDAAAASITPPPPRQWARPRAPTRTEKKKSGHHAPP